MDTGADLLEPWYVHIYDSCFLSFLVTTAIRAPDDIIWIVTSTSDGVHYLVTADD